MKKKKFKNRPIADKAVHSKPAENYSIKPTADPKVLKKVKIYLGIIITVFAFILYAQSINHNYTLDDHPVIDQNNITTQGIAGISTILTTDYWYGTGHNELRGPIYRPTSLIIFAIVWQFSPDNPHVYHFINVLLYAITCLILFLVLCKLFKNQNLLFPFVCCLLYAAHPIHTEVVNNIKSLDEILCFLFGLISISFLIRYHSTKSALSFVLGGVSFFLALISKETGITFLIIIPLILFFFYENVKKTIVSVSILLVALMGLWLILRGLVFKDLHQNIGVVTSVLNNTLNAAPDFVSKYATIFYTLLKYITLLIFPHPLSCDYNFAQIKIQTLHDLAPVIGIIFYLCIGIYSIINFRKKSVVAFGILFFLITLAPVSNIFFLGGSTMAERFMYIPSLGFCIILTYYLIKFIKKESIKWKYNNPIKFFSLNSTVFLFLIGIIFLYSIKTFSRNKDWKDNITIFSHDVQVSKNSASAHTILGSSLLELYTAENNKPRQDSILNLAIKELKRGIEILQTASTYSPMNNFHLGIAYLYKGDYQNAIPNFEEYLNKYPNPNISAYINLGEGFNASKKFDSACYYLRKGLERAPDDIKLNFTYGTSLSYLKKYDEAEKILTHTIALDPNYVNAYFNLASTYFNKGDFDKGLFYYSKVIRLNPSNASAYYYSGLILKAKGDTLKAKEFLNKATSLGYNPK